MGQQIIETIVLSELPSKKEVPQDLHNMLKRLHSTKLMPQFWCLSEVPITTEFECLVKFVAAMADGEGFSHTNGLSTPFLRECVARAKFFFCVPSNQPVSKLCAPPLMICGQEAATQVYSLFEKSVEQKSDFTEQAQQLRKFSSMFLPDQQKRLQTVLRDMVKPRSSKLATISRLRDKEAMPEFYVEGEFDVITPDFDLENKQFSLMRVPTWSTSSSSSCPTLPSTPLKNPASKKKDLAKASLRTTLEQAFQKGK